MDRHRRCGHPLGKKKKTERQVHHSLSSDTPALAKDLQETDSDDDDYGEDKWDPHAGTKPSPLDGEASDEQWDPEDEVEDIADEAFNGQMVKMISDLQDDDLRDLEWKPKRKARKRAKSGPRKAPSFGPDVAMKSARSQRCPEHRRAMANQSKLTSFGITLSRTPASSPLPPSSPLPSSQVQTASPVPTSPSLPPSSPLAPSSPLPTPSPLAPLSPLPVPPSPELTSPVAELPPSDIPTTCHKRQRHSSTGSLVHSDLGDRSDLSEVCEGDRGMADNEEAAIKSVLSASGTDPASNIEVRSWKDLREQLKGDIIDAHKK
ncbi:hypothetical protein EI94DRAFT_1801468 [Lactarius quietus]|nr:hypothetical protein EI94DRAFT_1801468 [Lactarius quietus]